MTSLTSAFETIGNVAGIIVHAIRTANAFAVIFFISLPPYLKKFILCIIINLIYVKVKINIGNINILRVIKYILFVTLILDYDIISKETKTNNRAVGGDMLLRQIKYFCTIVEEGSFTEAAEKCFISQSAISQQIQSLEKELGVKLIKRENRRFSLTHAGEYMYRHGTALLLEAERICKELNNAIALFSEKYPEVSISVITGTHEEIYDLLRSDDIDIAINDQRRAFSDEFVNFELGKARCYAEVCLRNDLSQKERVTVDDLKNMPCILITSKEQQKSEREFYQQVLGFGGNFIYAQTLDEGQLMVAGNRGFMPVERIGTFWNINPAAKRLPLLRDGKQIQPNYCAFWKVKNSNYYIEEFANELKVQLNKN